MRRSIPNHQDRRARDLEERFHRGLIIGTTDGDEDEDVVGLLVAVSRSYDRGPGPSRVVLTLRSLVDGATRQIRLYRDEPVRITYPVVEMALPELWAHVGFDSIPRLREWLARPNGSFTASPRVSFDAVTDGGVHVHVRPYRSPDTEETYTMSDPVHHPKHYAAGRFGVECIEFTRRMTGTPGNAFKHVFRHAEKNGVEDLRKALVYLGWAAEDNVAVAVSGTAHAALRRMYAVSVAPELSAVDPVYTALGHVIDGDWDTARDRIEARIDELVSL